MDIQKEFEYRATDVERILVKYLPKESGYQKTVFEAMNYSLMVGGKRLRPILMEETFKLFGGTTKAIEPFMAAIEMIHNYSLVHDDLPEMDNDMLRRGNPTTHAKFGQAMGVLAGDALLNYAFETALTAFDVETEHPERVVAAMKVLAHKAGVYGMIGGQVVDVEEEKQNGISHNRIDFVYEHKTGALIEASMMIGAILAGADEEHVKIMEEVGSKIGLAFQIQDDILDVTSDTETLGKPVGSDEKNHKSTYVSLLGLDKARDYEEELFHECIDQVSGIRFDHDMMVEMIKKVMKRVN